MRIMACTRIYSPELEHCSTILRILKFILFSHVEDMPIGNFAVRVTSAQADANGASS